ncbi:MAG: NUDIX hydrolase [Anaerolineales bacterium]|nr:NUDIX hydrolase [Anaerolineales bacterium]MCX7607793.1 NUDIX hydrolase [Anaerolineales bacterium]MDW8226396.1 NUDIX hydrolase [Anaerolineales bacterium]
MSFELLRSEVVYRGRAFSVCRDRVRLPDGRETTLDIVNHLGSVVILPLDHEGNLLFIRQYRHAARKELLELPAGVLNPDEPPETCARRELREETGMNAGRMEPLGSFYLAPGYSTEYMHVYFATDLYPAPLEADADEFLAVEKIPLDQALDLPSRGLLQDAKSLAALLLAQQQLAEMRHH